MSDESDAYRFAQSAMADLKASIRMVLATSPDGMKNAEIGRLLGIYAGHVGHEGHIPRTLLALMEAEGVVAQEPATKLWRLKTLQDWRSGESA